MRISVIGCGYLGAVHAACMAKLGHEVVGYDVDHPKIAALSTGKTPFFEPGLDELLTQQLGAGRLTFVTDPAALQDCEIHFVCVGTPQRQGEAAADLTYVDAAFADLLPHLAPGAVVAGKSTVPVGTAARLAATVQEAGGTLAWNPEFLREGHAIDDTLHPHRLVYGLPPGEDADLARKALDEVYAPLLDDCPVVATDYATAELVKVAANSFLATKISFINAMAELCEATGGDVTQLATAIGYDPRIGSAFLSAGLGFGGGCLPKDIRAFMARAGELGVDQALTFLGEVDSINLRRRARVVDLAREVCDGSIVGVRIAVLGAAFKPNSDDVRDSPALSVASQAALRGAQVIVTDPCAVANAAAKWPELTFVDRVEDALRDAELVLLLTEWDDYVGLDPVATRELVSRPRIVDGRNCLDPAQWRSAGWTYRALGRP
jgi:UDPglucose 6-dehydrogenase